MIKVLFVFACTLGGAFCASFAQDITLADGTILKNAKIVQRDDASKTITVSFSGGVAQVRSEMVPSSQASTLQPNTSNPTPTRALKPNSPIPADWTVDGRQFHNVKIGEVEADRVHITYDGGLGTVPIADLPPDLQKRFNYDASAGNAMAQQREQQAAQSDAVRYAVEAQQAKEKLEQESRNELEKHPCFMQGYVLEKMPEGILAQCEMPEITADSSASIGGGGGVYAPPNECPIGAERIYGTFLLKNAPNEASLVDKSPIQQVCYPSGTYSYTTVVGGHKTIAAYTAVLP